MTKLSCYSFTKESLRLSIVNGVIHLSPEKPRVLAEIVRVLRPGGRLLVSDRVAADLPAELAGHRRLYSFCLAGAISEEAYLEGLRQTGLIEVIVRDRLVYDTAHSQNTGRPGFKARSPG